MFNSTYRYRRNRRFKFCERALVRNFRRLKVTDESECDKMTQQQVIMKNMEEAAKKLLPGSEVKINGNSYVMDRKKLTLEPLSSKFLTVVKNCYQDFVLKSVLI
jgi:hypothetical protein